MITYLRKIQLHPLLLLIIILALITGTFLHLFVIFTIILVHEFGHYIMAKRYGWNVQKIVLWIFGGVMETEEHTHHPIRQDVIVTIAGPIQHVWMFFCIYVLHIVDIFPQNLIDTMFYYNWLLLAFNLLPIYPLDGGKLLFYFLSIVLPYKKSHQYTYRFSILASICVIILLIFQPFTFSAFMLLLFILIENMKEWRQHPYKFIRFLLNRNKMQKSERIIADGSNTLMDIFKTFKRSKYHYIVTKENNKQLTESEAMNLYFKEGKINETIQQLAKTV